MTKQKETMQAQAKAAQYAEMMQLCAAYVREFKPLCSDAAAVADLIRPLMAQGQEAGQESVWIVMLNAKNRSIGAPVEITRGTLDSCAAPPREVMRAALLSNASGIVIAHNHPSGDPTPSSSDVQVTRQMVDAGRVIGIRVLDHVIIGTPTAVNPGYVSIREQGLVAF